MTRDEMIERMSSRELSGWLALFQVEAEEAQHRRDVIESGDSHVIVSGRDDDEDDADEGGDGGQTE